MTDDPIEGFINPIDKEHIAENPHLLPYAHTRGGVNIKPVDKGKLKGRAVTAMYEQTDIQLDQIKQQIELLAVQARAIQNRVSLSERIYLADISFSPIISKIYHMYRRPNGKDFLSMVAPQEWGANVPFKFVATLKLLADHTWEVQVTGDVEALEG
jgi:Protein of unknown function (DUF2452)